jgi:hypothetical protein
VQKISSVDERVDAMIGYGFLPLKEDAATEPVVTGGFDACVLGRQEAD